MSEKHPLVVVEPRPEGSRVDEIPGEDPAAPKVGRWYWVKDTRWDGEAEEHKEFKWFGCVVHVGSNYAELNSPQGWEARIHFDEFWGRCEFVPNPDEVIKGKIGHYQREVHALMAKVKEITSRLAITPGPALPAGAETQALALRGSGQNIDEYKAALVLAQEKTLPELFKEIKDSNASLGRWLSAELIPLKAQAEGMEPAIEAIKNRIFSVELYAGLTEQVEQIADGTPADLNEKVHLLQRRAYMDEECLAQYETGGMVFKDIRAFDAWLARPKNRDRLLPFQRCIVAFQVRRNAKHREWGNLREFVRMLEDEQADKFTFLYIRNGEQLFRLSTAIEFDSKLFPDMDAHKLSGPLYAEVWNSGGVHKLITENEWKGMVEEEEAKIAKAKTVPKKDRWQYEVHFRESTRFSPFNRENVYYDDIAAHIREEMNKHNRLVLVLQGLLDRSPVLHPHPPWQLWTGQGFEQALSLVYDDSRALVAGEKPDFEAYRARLNASLKAGSITVGQEDDWERQEAIKENNRMDRDYRHKRSDYRPSRYRPYGNPGPGKIARALKVSPRKGTCTFEWTRERQTQTYDDSDNRIRCTVTVKIKRLLNIDAYKPGDFRQFFDDPRTRAEYLRWAPLLLEAEEYHAGNRKVPPPIKPVQRRKTEDGAWQYQRRKERLAMRHKAIRLERKITTQGGKVYEPGTLWRVGEGRGDYFNISGISSDGKPELENGTLKRFVRDAHMGNFIIDPEIPVDPELVEKERKRKEREQAERDEDEDETEDDEDEA